MLKSIHSRRYKDFLRFLRTERERVGVTQQVLGERIGVPQSIISKMESGERRLDVIEVMEICEALEIDSKIFFSSFIDSVEG